MSTPTPRQTLRFLDFELDVAAYELRHAGRRVRLEKRPMDLLIFMVARPGLLVTRTEIVKALWGDDVFIEVDTAVNTVVRKIRQALRDSSDAPRFIETVAGKGYRFIAPVEVPASLVEIPEPAGTLTERAAPVRAAPGRRRGLLAIAALIAATALGVLAWRSAHPRPTHVRLAVLPFEVSAVDRSREYLGDALHEETIAALGQVDPARIEVITRRSMLQYRDKARPLAQIAQELGVQYFVESSIHLEDARIRVLARLIRAEGGKEIWRRTYDNEPRSMLDFQRALSVKIAEEIRHSLAPDRLDALARRHSANAEAFQLYLQGLAAWNQLTPQTTERAIGFYMQATQRDPAYALPWAGLALAFAGAPINADADPLQTGPQARRTAGRAMASDPLLAEAQTADGAVKFWFDWDWTGAEAMFKKAVATDPNYAFGRRMVGIALAHQGRHDEARDSMRQLLRLEPAYEMNWALRAQVAFLAREYAEAIEFAQQASVIERDFWIADYQLAMAYEQANKHDLALQVLERHQASPRPNSKVLSLRGYVLGKSGRSAEARAVLATLEAASRARYIPPYARALVHAGLGDQAAALDWLEKAIDVRDVHLIAIPTDPKWDPLRRHPRFAAILKRCGFAARASQS